MKNAHPDAWDVVHKMKVIWAEQMRTIWFLIFDFLILDQKNLHMY